MTGAIAIEPHELLTLAHTSYAVRGTREESTGIQTILNKEK